MSKKQRRIREENKTHGAKRIDYSSNKQQKNNKRTHKHKQEHKERAKKTSPNTDTHTQAQNTGLDRTCANLHSVRENIFSTVKIKRRNKLEKITTASIEN